MKVWVVSHTYVVAVHHDKLRMLGALDDIELTVLIPENWETETATVRLPHMRFPYDVVVSRIARSGRIGAYRYLDCAPLRRARADVVHAEVEPWSLAALQLVRAAAGAPVVLFTWENLEGPRRLISRAIERYVLRRVAHVIAGNEGARARMLRRGVPDPHITVLPQLGIDVARYAGGHAARARANHTITAGGQVHSALRSLGPPIVGFIGRLVPEKGVDILVEAIERFDARLLVIGDGVARAGLEARTSTWPAGKATFTGAVPEAAVPDYLACMDALVLPSRTTASWAEQFGHVLIEAMAAGVPVVGSSSGAIPEVIGEAGLVFPEGDAAGLRAQLAALFDDPALRKRAVERGRARVERLYTNERIVRAQRAIYAQVLAERGR